MIDSPLSRALDFIRANQNPDGGWGYEPGRTSMVEPTGLCALALHTRGDDESTDRALGFLRSCQGKSGAVGFGPRDSEGSWMAYAALLAFHGLGALEEENRLKSWVLTFEDASGRFTKDELAVIAARYHYDASIQGWGWTPRTTAWVEPTALFIIALVRSGVPPSEKRIRSGLDLLLDRRAPSGGWNFGNPFSGSYELEPSAMSSALALTALFAAGLAPGRPAAEAGLRFLHRVLAGDVSTASLAWCLLALKGSGTAASIVPGMAARLSRLQRDDGAYRGNLFETSLAYLVLSDAPILASPPEESR